MTIKEMVELRDEYGPDMVIDDAVHLHDEDEWNKFTISYKGIIVGSELVTKEFVRDYIAQHFKNRNPSSEYLALMRNAQNAALCIVDWAERREDAVQNRPGSVHWGHVGFANDVLKKLMEINKMAGQTVKEVC